MKRFIFFVYLLVNVVLSSELYFIEPKDGQVVEKTFVVKFGLKDFGVAPAGYDINNTGHHHLLIDVELPDLNKPIPADANHLHFGGGQTETLVTLSPGEYSLQLLVGDKFHIPHNPPVISEKIKVTVTR